MHYYFEIVWSVQSHLPLKIDRTTYRNLVLSSNTQFEFSNWMKLKRDIPNKMNHEMSRLDLLSPIVYYYWRLDMTRLRRLKNLVIQGKTSHLTLLPLHFAQGRLGELEFDSANWASQTDYSFYCIKTSPPTPSPRERGIRSINRVSQKDCLFFQNQLLLPAHDRSTL